MSVEESVGESQPTRSEVAEYVHDMAGQLAEMAERAGLAGGAALLRDAQRAIEKEY